jgi:hypothetical protein
MGANLDLIRATYEGSSSEENGRNLLAALAPDAAWTEAEGFPYAGTWDRRRLWRACSSALPLSG